MRKIDVFWILNRWRKFKFCDCTQPKPVDTPRFCECGGLIGHSGMCDCPKQKNEMSHPRIKPNDYTDMTMISIFEEVPFIELLFCYYYQFKGGVDD